MSKNGWRAIALLAAKESPAVRKNLEDVARLAGVGLATVDRVLNERGGVALATAIRVLEAARQLQPRRPLPSPYARRLRMEIIMAQPDECEISKVNTVVERLLPELGSAMTLQRRFVPAKRTAALPDAIIDSKADGLIVFAPEMARIMDAIAAKTSSGVPVITIMSDLPTTPRLSYVGIDHERAGRAAGFFLAQMSSPDAGTLIVCNDLDYRFEAERVTGFRAAWAELGASSSNIGVVECAESPGLAWESITKAVRQSDNLGAVYNTGVDNRVLEQGLASAKCLGRVKCITHELDEITKRLLRNDQITLVIDQDLERQIMNAIDHLRKRFGLKGEETSTPRASFQLLTRDNLIE